MGRLVGVLLVVVWMMACTVKDYPVVDHLQPQDVESGWDATHSVLTLVTADPGSDIAIPSRPESFEHTCADG